MFEKLKLRRKVIPAVLRGTVELSDVEETPLKPLDRKIAEGLRIDTTKEELLPRLQTRLAELFEAARNDESGEFGRCIGWTPYQPPEEYLGQIDAALLTTAAQQNHGMKPQLVGDGGAESMVLWNGTDLSGRVFSIRRRTGQLPLEGAGTADCGVVYSLISSSAPAETS